jgi:hypothetical protein
MLRLSKLIVAFLGLLLGQACARDVLLPGECDHLQPAESATDEGFHGSSQLHAAVKLERPVRYGDFGGVVGRTRTLAIAIPIVPSEAFADFGEPELTSAGQSGVEFAPHGIGTPGQAVDTLIAARAIPRVIGTVPSEVT